MALNHVFSLTGMNFASNVVASRMFQSFEKFYAPREVRPPDWNLSLVLRCLSRPSFEPLKLASDKHLTGKTPILFVLALAKRVSELHGLSFCVCYSWGWRLCTFSFLLDFIAATQKSFCA